MFSIDYIKLLNGNYKEIKKNLQENQEYRFNTGALDEDFFAPNVYIHAIVGKNGSGKSTLMEILFRLINNLSYVLMKFIHREAADQLCYVFGLYAEVGWHEGNKRGYLKCENNEVTFFYDGFEIKRHIGDGQGSPLSGDRFVASTGKRPGEDKFFSGAFVVFRRISAIFRKFCLVVMEFFVNLPAKG